MSEHNNFMDFYSTPPSCGVEPKNGLVPSLDDSVLFVDNTSAIATARTSADTKPKSTRHYALRRYFRVRDAGGEGKFRRVSVLLRPASQQGGCWCGSGA